MSDDLTREEFDRWLGQRLASLCDQARALYGERARDVNVTLVVRPAWAGPDHSVVFSNDRLIEVFRVLRYHDGRTVAGHVASAHDAPPSYTPGPDDDPPEAV